MTRRNIDSLLVHAGTPEPRVEGAVVTPIFQSANYEQADPTDYSQVTYIRLNNTPNHRALCAKLAAIEDAEDAMVFGSGMAAITTALLSVVGAGDHVLLQGTVYGGTRTFFDHEAPRLGIEFTVIDSTKPQEWEAALRPNTKLMYVESISNPLLDVADLPAVVAFAKAHGLVTAVDNTFLSPVNFRPLEHGFDLVLHSATKYLNGHSDLVAGVVAGSRERVAPIRGLLNHLGGSLDPHACFLLERGLKTLGLRVRQQNATARALAEALSGHPLVAEVRYPGLPEDPGADRAALFDGCGGMVSFYVHDADIVDRFFSELELPVNAASLGGVESLIVRPSRSTHLGMDPADREVLGIRDTLVRISVGIEDTRDLIDDVLRALNACGTTIAGK